MARQKREGQGGQSNGPLSTDEESYFSGEGKEPFKEGGLDNFALDGSSPRGSAAGGAGGGEIALPEGVPALGSGTLRVNRLFRIVFSEVKTVFKTGSFGIIWVIMMC